jgi:hypothetical protein
LSRSRWPWNRSGLCLQLLFGLPNRSIQRQQQRLEQVALAVEQVGAVRRLQTFLGTADQGTCQVAGQLDHRDEHACGTLGQGPFPGGGVAAVAVALDEEEARHRLQADQAGLAAVEVFVRHHGDGLGLHLPGQGGLFLVAEGHQVRLEVNDEGMQGTTRGADEAVESGPLEEGADQADAASALELERGQGSQNQATEEGFAAAGTQEGHEVGFEVGGVVTAEPIAQGGARDVLLGGILPLGTRGGLAEVIEGFGGLGTRPTEGVWARWGGVGSLRGSHGSRPRCLLAEPP